MTYTDQLPRERAAISNSSQDRPEGIVDHVGHTGITRGQVGLSEFDQQAYSGARDRGAERRRAQSAGRKVRAKKQAERDESADINERIFPESAGPVKCPPKRIQHRLPENPKFFGDKKIVLRSGPVVNDAAAVLIKKIKSDASIV